MQVLDHFFQLGHLIRLGTSVLSLNQRSDNVFVDLYRLLQVLVAVGLILLSRWAKVLLRLKVFWGCLRRPDNELLWFRGVSIHHCGLVLGVAGPLRF